MRDYNFFEIYENRKGISFNPRSPYFIGAIIVLICVALSAGLIVQNMIRTRQIDSTNEELMKVKADQDYIQAKKLQDNLRSMEEYDSKASTALEKFISADLIDSQLMTDLFNGLPSNAVVVFFNAEGLELDMTCDIPNRETAAELLLGLKQTGLLQAVSLETVEAKQDNSGFIVRVSGLLKAGEVE